MENCKDCVSWKKYWLNENYGTCLTLEKVLEIQFDTEQDCDYATVERIMTPAMFGCPHFERRK